MSSTQPATPWRHAKAHRGGAPHPGIPEAGGRAEPGTGALARPLASSLREELLAIMREIFERNAVAGRLAYSPDEAAGVLGISPELVYDLLRTGQLGSVKAGRRRLISRANIDAFLAGDTGDAA